MTEMSVREDVRRTPSSIVEDNGVEGMLEDDNHGLVSGKTGAATGTGLDKPGVSDSNETRDTCIGRVILGLKELCRKNGVNEILTASLVGRVAIDLCKATKE